MSVAVPPIPADGWCMRIRACGSACRLPGVPADSRNWPIEAANPTAHVATSGLISCIVSWMAIPAVTEPPGELM